MARPPLPQGPPVRTRSTLGGDPRRNRRVHAGTALVAREIPGVGREEDHGALDEHRRQAERLGPVADVVRGIRQAGGAAQDEAGERGRGQQAGGRPASAEPVCNR